MSNNLKFKYFLTTRGLSKHNNNRILSLESTPDWFHPYVTIVTAKSEIKALKEKYPTVSFWASPEEINSAALKRKWIFENAPEDIKDFVLMNDEMRLSISLNGKIATINSKEGSAEFKKHLLRFEELSSRYVGFSAGTRSFNNQNIADGKEIVENRLVGAFFHYNRKFALAKLKLGRLNYHEDCDYTLQTLSQGYKTGNYLGILYEGRTHKPRRYFTDRTREVQLRDSAKLLKWFPEAVSVKEDYDEMEQDMDLSIRYSKAYSPKMRVLFVCHGNVNRSAAAEIILKKRVKNIEVKSCGVKDNAGGEITAKKTRIALAELGYKTDGIRSTKATTALINKADVVFYMDQGNLKRLTEQFPKAKDKFVNLAQYVNQKKIADPGFISDPKLVLEITMQIHYAIMNWIEQGKPLPNVQ